MATHSRTLAWRIPWTEFRAWWAAVHGVAQSRTQLKQLSSSSSSCRVCNLPLIGWGWGRNRVLFQQSQSSTSWLQPVWGPQTCSQPEVITLHPRGRPYYRRRAQKSPQEEWGWPHHCLLTASPLFLLTLTPLMSNCLNLPFGTQGRSRRLKSFSYKQEVGVKRKS